MFSVVRSTATFSILDKVQTVSFMMPNRTEQRKHQKSSTSSSPNIPFRKAKAEKLEKQNLSLVILTVSLFKNLVTSFRVSELCEALAKASQILLLIAFY